MPQPIIPVSSVYPVTDSLPFPLKIGAWWKYQRIDSSYYNNNFGYPYKTDSSAEIISVVNNKKLTDSVLVWILEVNNVTYSAKDTLYAFYFRTNFIITKSLNNVSGYADNKFLNQYDMRFRLPSVEGKYLITNGSLLSSSDSICIKKDSTAQILKNTFSSCLYTSEYKYDFMGSYANTYFSKSLLKSNIGLVYWYAEYDNASHYGTVSDAWYIRRLVDYFIP